MLLSHTLSRCQIHDSVTVPSVERQRAISQRKSCYLQCTEHYILLGHTLSRCQIHDSVSQQTRCPSVNYTGQSYSQRLLSTRCPSVKYIGQYYSQRMFSTRCLSVKSTGQYYSQRLFSTRCLSVKYTGQSYSQKLLSTRWRERGRIGMAFAVLNSIMDDLSVQQCLQRSDTMLDQIGI
jgi:hypothetical protein